MCHYASDCKKPKKDKNGENKNNSKQDNNEGTKNNGHSMFMKILMQKKYDY